MRLRQIIMLASFGTLSFAVWGEAFEPIHFAKGSSSAQLVGDIQANNSKVYRFWAKKGQLLTVANLVDSPVEYALLPIKHNVEQILSGRYQVLPYTGMYEWRAVLNRQFARTHSKDTFHYAVRFKIENVTEPNVFPPMQINYRCSNAQFLPVHFLLEEGKSAVGLNWQGKSLKLIQSGKYSQPNNPVYANEHYMLSLGTLDNGNLMQSQVYSLLSLDDDKAVLQDCVVE
ncbi:hypothetical protein HPC38_06230 [Pasteurellaceae bacterium HPA106]|uniref:hypothetical protein n=1 Tax=Spirabiliibacterium pneumoniae TaxID=221400 RepID=UPI001AADEF40|nr:hypothetical protein [Spirabiliibacterium pneumoniae]MBE2896470.1 hypothetical protein [Spirabiliibacterium pneumoniae]